MMLTHEGITQPVREWALDYGIPANLIRERLRRGWPVGRAITTPMPFVPCSRLDEDTPSSGGAAGRKRRLEYGGLSLTVGEWAERQGLSYSALAFRLRNGWPLHKALAPPMRARPKAATPGVVSNFATFAGTGAGSTAQETPEITFSDEDDF